MTKSKIGIVAISAILALASIVGCGGSSEVATTSTTSTVPALTDTQVEGFFAADRSQTAAKVGAANNGIVSVDNEDCTITGDDTATCIESLTYTTGYIKSHDTIVWYITYTPDGQITSYDHNGGGQ